MGGDNIQVADWNSADVTLADLYGEYRRPVLCVVQRLLGDASQAEDVLQETFLRVWQKRACFDPDLGAVDTWIITIARRLAIDYLRKKIALAKDPSYWLMTLSCTPADPCRQEWVRQQLLLLSDSQRHVITLAYFEGMSHREISAQLKRPLGTVKSQIRSALLVLKANSSIGQ